MFVRLVAKSMWRRKGYTALALAAVAVGASLAAALLSFESAVRAHLRGELAAFGPNLRVQETATGGRTPRLTDLPAIREALGPRFAGAAPFASSVARLRGGRVLVVGTDLGAARALFPGWRLEGSEPGSAEIVLGAELARRLALRPGTSLAIAPEGSGAAPRVVRVSGVLETGGREEEQAFVGLGVFASIYPQRAGEADLILVRSGGDATALAAAAAGVAAALPGLAATPVARVRDAEEALVQRVRLLLAGVTLGALVLAGLCSMTTTAAIVTEREREIAIMEAVGLTRRTVDGLFAAELAIVALAGGALGTFGGGVLARLAERQLFAAVAPHATVMPQVLAVAVVLTLAAAWPPLRRSRHLAAADVLRGE